jgi:hypothetical protein
LKPFVSKYRKSNTKKRWRKGAHGVAQNVANNAAFEERTLLTKNKLYRILARRKKTRVVAMANPAQANLVQRKKG